MERGVKDRAGNIAAFLVVIAVNGMANGLPINGRTTGEVSADYPTLFTPAGFTFSIWGVIYLCLAAFVVYQALPAQQNSAAIARIDNWFKLNCLANASWIFAWHYDLLIVAMLLMLGLLATLILIFRSMDANTSPFIRVPFSLYTAWITVATIANVSVLQTAWGLNNAGLDAVQWTWLKLAVAGAIAAVIVSRTRNLLFAAVIAWAAYGIYHKQSATPEVSGAAATLCLMTLLLAAGSLLPDRRAQ